MIALFFTAEGRQREVVDTDKRKVQTERYNYIAMNDKPEDKPCESPQETGADQQQQNKMSTDSLPSSVLSDSVEYVTDTSSSGESVGYTSDESSKHSDEQQPHVNNQISTLRTLVSETNSPYCHQQLICALGNTDDLDAIRLARHNYANNHSLSEHSWKQWIQDEINLAMSEDEINRVLELIQRAASSCPCPSLFQIWLDYIHKHKQTDHKIDIVKRVIQLAFQYAATAHFFQGFKLNNIYNSSCSASSTQQQQQQQQNNFNTIIHTENDESNSEFRSAFEIFENRIKNRIKPIEKLLSSLIISPSSDSALDLNSIDEYNEKQKQLNDKSNEIVPIFLSYISYCNENNLYSCAISIHERCVQLFPQNPTIWNSYLGFISASAAALDDEQKAQNIIPNYSNVVERATFNCPNNLNVWYQYIKRIDQIDVLVKSIERAVPYISISNDLSCACKITRIIWVTYFNLTTDQTTNDSNFDTILQTTNQLNIPLSTQWGSAVYFAANFIKDAERRAQTREEVIEMRPSEVRWWLLYIQGLEFDNRNAMTDDASLKIRGLFERGMSKMSSISDLDILEDSWLQFETKYSLHTLNEWIDKIDEVKEKYKEEINQRVNNSFHGANKNTNENGQQSREEREVGKQQQQNNRRGKTEKRRRNDRSVGIAKKNKRQRRSNDKEKKENTSNEVKDEETIKDQIEDMEINSNDKDNNDMEHDKKVKENAKASGMEPRTIYLNNLPFQANEEELRKTFSFAGTIREVRLPRRSDGATKGFAYIEFEEDDAVDKALTKHRSTVLGREIWIRRSQRRPQPASIKNNKQKKIQPNKSKQSGSANGNRTIRKSRLDIATTSNKNDMDIDMQDGDRHSSKDEVQPKTQDDFRKLLFGKKQ